MKTAPTNWFDWSELIDKNHSFRIFFTIFQYYLKFLVSSNQLQLIRFSQLSRLDLFFRDSSRIVEDSKLHFEITNWHLNQKEITSYFRSFAKTLDIKKSTTIISGRIIIQELLWVLEENWKNRREKRVENSRKCLHQTNLEMPSTSFSPCFRNYYNFYLLNFC